MDRRTIQILVISNRETDKVKHDESKAAFLAKKKSVQTKITTALVQASAITSTVSDNVQIITEKDSVAPKSSIMINCTICGRPCKGAAGLVSHMRAHKNKK